MFVKLYIFSFPFFGNYSNISKNEPVVKWQGTWRHEVGKQETMIPFQCTVPHHCTVYHSQRGFWILFHIYVCT